MSSDSKMLELCLKLITLFGKNLIQDSPLTVGKNLIKINPDPFTRIILLSLFDLIIAEQNNIDTKVKKLIEEPLKSGCDYLKDASEVSEGRREEWLKLALEKFTTASNIEASLDSARAQFYVGVCYDLLNEPQLAINWYEKAYQSAWSTYTSLKNPQYIKDKFTTLTKAARKKINETTEAVEKQAGSFVESRIPFIRIPKADSEQRKPSRSQSKQLKSADEKPAKGNKLEIDLNAFIIPLSDLLNSRDSKLDILLPLPNRD